MIEKKVCFSSSAITIFYGNMKSKDNIFSLEEVLEIPRMMFLDKGKKAFSFSGHAFLFQCERNKQHFFLNKIKAQFKAEVP